MNLARCSKTWRALLVIALLSWTAALPAADRPAMPAAGVLRATLKNGLRVAIVRNPVAPVVAVEVNYLAGSNEAPAGFPGMAHAQEHMMFRGSPGLTAGQLAYLNAAMGGRANADTQFTVTQYSNTVLAQDLDIVLQIEAIRMRAVLDSDPLWDEERAAIEQEVAQDLSRPDYLLYAKLLQSLFSGTPYAHDALGTRPSFDQTTGAMLKAFYHAWYAPNNAILVIVGDVEPRRVLAQVERLFGSIPARKLPKRPSILLQPVRAQRLELKTDRANGTVVVAFRMLGYDSPDYAAVQLLGDALDSKRADLFGLVVDGKALSTSFDVESMRQVVFGYAAADFPLGADAAGLLQQVRSILERYANHGLPEDLVVATKRREITERELQKNSIPGLAEAWSLALAVEGRQSPQDDIEALKRVSVADVNRVARKYLDPNSAIVAVVTPEISGAPVVSRPVKRTESVVESLARRPTRASAPPEWARKRLRAQPSSVSAVHPVDMTLANGLRLIVQPQSISDTVSVYGRVRTEPDLQAPPGQEGVDRVLAALFPFGTETLDRVALLRALDAIGANLSAGSKFSIKVLSRYFDRAVQLLADNELHPAFPEEAFKTVREQVASAVARELKTPNYLTKRALALALLPKGDPRLRQATSQSVSSLTLQQVKDYHQRVFHPDLTTVVVIGKVSPEQAKAVIEKHFGSWKAQGPKPQTDLPPVPSNSASAVVVPDASRVQDKVFLAEMLGINRMSPDYYALELGNHVLDGGFYATRLYHDLREETGLVYQVGSEIDASRTRTAYVVEYACDPANVARARAIIERDLKEMQAVPVSDATLRQAKDLALTDLALEEASVSKVADGLLDRAMLGLTLDEPSRAAQRYATLSAAEIREAFARWLRLPDLVQVTEGPAPQ